MKTIISTIMLFVTLLFISSNTLAQDYGVRIRLQGKSSKPGFGLSGVVEIPTLTDARNVIAGIGICHNSNKLELSLHVGMLTLPFSNATSLVDFRSTVGGSKKDNIFAWINLRLQTLEDMNKMLAYGFIMFDYKLATVGNSNIFIGIETENRRRMSRMPDTSDYSAGPNLIYQITQKARIEAAFQFHSDVANQVWARLHLAL